MWTQIPPDKRAHPLHPIFGPCLLWPNGWMDEDVAWCGSRPRPRSHCTRRGPSSRERGTAAPALFSAHVYCGHGRPSQLLLSSCNVLFVWLFIEASSACIENIRSTMNTRLLLVGLQSSIRDCPEWRRVSVWLSVCFALWIIHIAYHYQILQNDAAYLMTVVCICSLLVAGSAHQQLKTTRIHIRIRSIWISEYWPTR